MDRRIRELARDLYLAQKSSDAGKGIYELKPLIDSFDKPADGYWYKDDYILKAIRQCIKMHNPNFQYGIGWEKWIGAIII